MLAAVDQFVNNATVTRDPLPKVVSNEILLGFLFQNLLQNACKYGRVDVPVIVHVSAERLGGGWQFSITDNGRGIPLDRIDAIFEPYVRAENVGADEPGFGIGLNFCRTIVEWHHGKIWAEPGANHGSVFKFTIPDPQVDNA
jgi:signal transduction histidine kinase